MRTYGDLRKWDEEASVKMTGAINAKNLVRIKMLEYIANAILIRKNNDNE